MPSRDEMIRSLKRQEMIDALKAHDDETSDPVEAAAGVANKAFDSVGQRITNTVMPAVSALGTAAEYVDKYTGAPVRSAVSAGLKGENPISAFTNQFGNSTATAPSGKDIGKQVGFSDKENFDTGLYTSPNRTLHLSPAGIAGAGIETATDPLMYIPGTAVEKVLGGAAKGFGKAAELGGRAAEKTFEYGAKGAGKLMAGMPFEYTERLLKNPKAIRNAPSIEDLKFGIDQNVEKIGKEAADLENKTKSHESFLNDLYKQKQESLKGSTTPISEARNVMAALSKEKQVLGSLSQQADDALLRSGATFKKDDLLRAVQKTGQELGDFVIGDAQKQAVGKLQDLHTRISSLPDELSAQQVRDVMQQIRADADYSLQAGEFNSISNKALKNLGYSLSSALKKESPEYAGYMQRMADLAHNLDSMNQYFGNESRALGSLESLRKQGGQGVKSSLAEDTLRRYAESTGRTDLLTKIDELKKNRELAKEMGSRDMRAELFPKEYGELSDLQGSLQMADRAMAGEGADTGIKRLSPSSSESIIKNLGGRNPKIENRKAIENLEQLTDEKYLEPIQNAGLKHQFETDQTRGSLFPFVGGALGTHIGYSVGGVPGALAGASAGAVAGAGTGRVAGKIIEKGVEVSKPIADMARGLSIRISRKTNQLGKYNAILSNAARRGEQALLSTHYVLMNNDPEYKKIMDQ